MRVAPIHICLSVVINKHRGVDIIPVLRLPHQRLTKRILERTIRRVGYQNADAMTMKRCIEIVLAIALYGLDGPCTIVAGAPRELLQGSHSTMLGPVHHIGGRPQEPVVHKETSRVLLIGIRDILGRGIVRGKEEQRVAYHDR